MATRIFVACKSHEMPGEGDQKFREIANIACMEIFERNFSPDNDRLITEGAYFIPKQRCRVLIDSGPEDVDNYILHCFNWDGKHMQPVTGASKNSIERLLKQRWPFNPANRPDAVGYTDEEYRNKYGIEDFERLQKGRMEKKSLEEYHRNRPNRNEA